MPQTSRARSNPPRRSSGFTLLEMMVVIAIIAVLAGILLPAVQQARESVRRTQCKNNLAQIGLALQNYANAFSVLPPGVVNRTGPIAPAENTAHYHMSWIAQVLPFLELQNEYRHIDFTRSVYSTENSAVRNRNLPVLRCASSNSRTTPTYAGVHHDVATAIDVDQNGMLFLNSAVRLNEVADGCSNTLLVVEALAEAGSGLGWMSGTSSTLRNGVVWENRGTPDQPPRYSVRPYRDLGPSMQQQLATMNSGVEVVSGPGSSHGVGFHVVMGDGSVKNISYMIDATLLRNLAHRSDGEMMGEF